MLCGKRTLFTFRIIVGIVKLFGKGKAYVYFVMKSIFILNLIFFYFQCLLSQNTVNGNFQYLFSQITIPMVFLSFNSTNGFKITA